MLKQWKQSEELYIPSLIFELYLEVPASMPAWWYLDPGALPGKNEKNKFWSIKYNYQNSRHFGKVL